MDIASHRLAVYLDSSGELVKLVGDVIAGRETQQAAKRGRVRLHNLL